jgi:two-component system sensor histidine kinase/response regulator
MNSNPTGPVLVIAAADETACEALGSALAPLGYPCVTATNEDALLRALLTHDALTLVFDLSAAAFLDAIQMIRHRPATSDLPVLLLAGSAPEAAVGRRLPEVGPVDTIFKPLDPDLLAHKVSLLASLEMSRRRIAELERALADVTGELARYREADAAPPSGSPPAGPPATAGPRRVLVVDDNAANRKVACRLLEHLGHHAHAVMGGLEALEALQQNTFALVLLDVRMPIIDGYETARRIRSAGHSIRVVALTASVDERERSLCLDAGMDDFLTKPFDINELQAVVAGAASSSA